MLNFNQDTLCGCCECNPSFSPPTSDERCTNVIDNCSLTYCNFDKILRDKPSVDCLRKTKNNILMMVEIKNQPSSNIDIENIKLKISSTIEYLFNNEPEIAILKKVFILSLSPQKQPRRVGNRQSSSFNKIGNFLAHKRISVFCNRYYNYKIGDMAYKLFSKVALCSDTDEICK